MTDTEILSMTKSNLEMLTTAHDAYLSMLITAAKAEIAREGITLSLADIGDCNIVVMYASYLYRKRAGDEQTMPRMLRYALNNRLFSAKVGDADASE